jgi:type II secretory pathway component PulM
MPVTIGAREKMLLTLLGALLVLAAGLWGLRQAVEYQGDLAARLEANRANLTELRTLDADLEKLGGAKLGARTLASALEDLMGRAGLRDRVQLNPVTQSASGRVQAMEIKAEQLTLDEMVRLVYMLEGPDVPVVVDQLEVAPSFRDKEMLRVSVRVLGQG